MTKWSKHSALMVFTKAIRMRIAVGTLGRNGDALDAAGLEQYRPRFGKHPVPIMDQMARVLSAAASPDARLRGALRPRPCHPALTSPAPTAGVTSPWSRPPVRSSTNVVAAGRSDACGDSSHSRRPDAERPSEPGIVYDERLLPPVLAGSPLTYRPPRSGRTLSM